MIDEQNSGVTADDSALFESLTSGNPAPAPEVVQPVEPTPTTVVQQPEAPQQPEPAIPPSRLREEAEARRAAEREAAELRGRIAALEAARQQHQQPPQPQAPQQGPDFWEKPEEYFENLLTPVQRQLQGELQQQREIFSKMMAEQIHGKEVVDAAYQALGQALQANPAANAAYYQQIMRSENPYGALVNWHKQQQILSEVGNDPAAYRARLLEDAKKDPAFIQSVIEAARGTAQQSGNVIAKPAVSSLPSLNKVGATALPEAASELSDAELFSRATTGRRK